MPLVRIGSDIHYFAHVPKCGGSSVENYLTARFGSLALVNTRYLSRPEPQRWTKSSPQHMTLDALGGLIPADWIASSFAVVRHPVKRLISAFQYQVEKEGTVSALWTVDDWFDDWLGRADAQPFLYDNHLRPMSDLVPADAAAFRLEDGMAGLVAHLDALAGNSQGPREIAHENARKGKSPAHAVTPTDATLTRIAAYYAEDFRRYGYDADPARAPRAMQPARPPAKGIITRIASGLRRGRG
jgi:hypothetical protein